MGSVCVGALGQIAATSQLRHAREVSQLGHFLSIRPPSMSTMQGSHITCPQGRTTQGCVSTSAGAGMPQMLNVLPHMGARFEQTPFTGSWSCASPEMCARSFGHQLEVAVAIVISNFVGKVITYS